MIRLYEIINIIDQSKGCFFDDKCFFSVDGNIAVGKSYFIETYLSDNVVAREPVELWRRILIDDEQSYTAFEYMYKLLNREG